MYDRYMGYLQGRECLENMAYFCLTVLEDSAVQRPRKASTRRKPSSKRKMAAEKYGTEVKVLTEIGFLSSEKGARKAGKDDLTAEERCLLEGALKAIIRRAAERACALPKISLQELLCP